MLDEHFGQKSWIKCCQFLYLTKSTLHLHLYRWFKSIDWEEVYQRQLRPPIVPNVSSDGDTRNFDNYPEEDWSNVEPITERQMAMFSDF